MRNRLIAVVLIVVAFAAGEVVGSMGVFGFQPRVMTGEASVGESGMTIMSGGTAYGAGRSVAWRDAAGSEHEDGWPDCLLAETFGVEVRFAGAFVAHEGTSQAEVLWIDCQGR